MSCLNPAAAASTPARLHVPERLPAGRPAAGLRPQGHHSDEQLRTLAYEVTLAEARERERIATGLHDDIGQVLAIVGLKLGELGESADPAARAELVGELRGLVQQASRATRTATFELSCPVLHQLGLQAAIESLAPRAKAANNLDLVVSGSLPPLNLPDQVLAVVFRVVRELVANVGRHARAGTARVQLYATADRLSVAVADDGAGFDTARSRIGFGPEGGYGLFSAEAQVQAIGGRLDIESAPGRGTRATILLPLANGEKHE
ncbi:sensor histidine kinase [Ramlibacter sp. WS9]|uniref:sensor histidine kinase n=1 Tax=Ramlibacter sp. WS9 TaxID=1882741 RepID=UPI0013050743|nr:sensor histidine kinase [Ramlibacter sp. WS9]